MKQVCRFMHLPGYQGRASRDVVLLALFLIGIRLVAGFIHVSCFNEVEPPPARSFHLHAGGDRIPCHHGKAPTSPLSDWACSVNQDESAFILPEVPLLPVVVSLFLPLLPLSLSFGSRSPIIPHGRGPPRCVLVL